MSAAAATELSPTLEELLADAEGHLYCARMIDSYPRMVRETSQWEARVAELKKQIEARDAGRP